MDDAACNYNPGANMPDDCTYAEANYDCDGNCIAEIDCAGECGGSAQEDECGECGGGGSSCDGCEDDPDICIWNSSYYNIDNQQDCEDSGGIWGGYLEYFGSSCNEMVNEAGCNSSILYWMVSDLCPESCGICLEGCTDVAACNYNPDATEDNDSCTYAEENYDCDGNCIAEVDCAGECAGSAQEDECGVCDGDGIPDGTCDCDGNVEDCAGECGGDAQTDECGVCGGDGSTCAPPEDFNFNQSTQQAFYYFNTVAINGTDVEAEDWVGAFNGDICVGARKWDTSICGNGVCDVPVMGNDASESTAGYMNAGDFPTFKIYDASENTYYDAVPDTAEAWENFGFYTIPSLNGWIWGCTNSNACNYNESATMNDGSCELPQGCNDWCSGDEGEPQDFDCTGECGGTTVIDACGVCGGNGPLEGYTCEGIPQLFTYNQSTLQSFYYFNSVTLYGLAIDNDDWVGAFNGDICVGSRKWDISLCNNGVCDIPIMGDDDNDWTEDYMEVGDMPTFKVFDASSNEYFVAIPSESIAWDINSINVMDSLQAEILGCTIVNACNYNSDAVIDDDSCIFPEENFDCEGNCIAEIDCEGECGGSGIIDDCGICNGSGPSEGFSCDGIPIEFVYNQSSLQAFYYIYETSDFTESPFAAEDWVGIFNGETCVGARQWNTSLCNNGICDVPAMGDDGYDYSEGYLNSGDLPSFKVYDFSEGDYFDAYPSENFPFENAGIFNINELVLDYRYSLPLHQHNNLVSFYVLPDDNSVSNVFLDIQENIVAISGEATSAQYFFDEDYWTGTLMDLNISSGYWIRLADNDTLDGSGQSYDPNRIYNLYSGANLVSFPSTGSVGISAALPDEIEDNVLAVVGEGMSTLNSDGGWEGSLMDFKALHGYWIITDADISFSYDMDLLEPLSRKVNPYQAAIIPNGFDYIQSTQQAFYFVEDIELINGEIEIGDWLFSYCGNTVTGSRQWLGRTVDIPTMGAEGNLLTSGYCGMNDTPHFKLLTSNSQKLISLYAETPKWKPNGIFNLGKLQEADPMPNTFEIHDAYPNPFNPLTQIRYEIPSEGFLEISIYDLRGQKVETLVNEFTQPGYYTASWDAGQVASGIYFVHFTASSEGKTSISQIQKLMLVK